VKTNNAMQLKALIKKKAAEKRISAQLVMQNYMLERLLERISLSPHKQKLILKGGLLISSIVGLDARATMDLDATIKDFDLTHETIRNVFEEVCRIPIEDDVVFEILGTSDIRETDDYPGIRVNLKANYPPISVLLTVDVTTGDKITPCAVEYTFPMQFDYGSINIYAYNLETILAEKLETVVSRGVANTRPRDFYDIYILWKLRGTECDLDVLSHALEQTSIKRGSRTVMTRYVEILNAIFASEQMRGFWKKYQEDFEYAKDISFEDAVRVVKEITSRLHL
jgi:predicted nucleotidyltransferase component of viral defense system